MREHTANTGAFSFIVEYFNKKRKKTKIKPKITGYADDHEKLVTYK